VLYLGPTMLKNLIRSADSQPVVMNEHINAMQTDSFIDNCWLRSTACQTGLLCQPAISNAKKDR